MTTELPPPPLRNDTRRALRHLRHHAECGTDYLQAVLDMSYERLVVATADKELFVRFTHQLPDEKPDVYAMALTEAGRGLACSLTDSDLVQTERLEARAGRKHDRG